mgnify:FL=1
MRGAQQEGGSVDEPREMGRSTTSATIHDVAPFQALAVSVEWYVDPLANAVDHLAQIELEERLERGGDEAEPPADPSRQDPTLFGRLGWGSWDA